VYYAHLLTASEQARDERMTARLLTKAGQVERPMGLAVDNARGVLYVADPGSSAVVSLRIFEEGGSRAGELAADAPLAVLPKVAAHWVAVDSLGTVFCSDARGHRIWSLPAGAAAARLRGGGADAAGGGGVVELYSAAGGAPIREPQGLAVDGFHLFWANGAAGGEVGSVVRGSEEELGPAPRHLATKGAAHGLCLSNSRLFYTDATDKIYSTRVDGGEAVIVAEHLREPRGCAYDGDGTVFVADPALGEVLAFSGGASSLGARPLVKALDVPGAYGLAVFATSPAVQLRAAWLLLLVLFLPLR